MTKSTITRERIQRIIRAIDSESYDEEEIREWLTSDEIMGLARMALAAMDNKPVFNLLVSKAGYKGQKQGNNFGFTTLDAARELKEGKYLLYRHAQQPVVSGWIPVSERLPEEGVRYWCYVEEQNSLGKSHYQWNCSWNGDVWYDNALTGRVTHWMPLPTAPQEVKK